MLARSEQQFIRVYGSSSLRTGIILNRYGRQGVLLTTSLIPGIRPDDHILGILAINYVGGVKRWASTTRRNVSTETRPPDKPFPLPTQKPQSNARTPPLPMPPQPPRVEPANKSADTKPAEAVVASAAETTVDKPKSEKKLTLWQKVKKEANHYWDGTKLLGKEIRISFRLALKMAAGYELSRRESRQLKRTTEDLIRLVPFSVFVIVPFAELLLPVALKLFPNMLPSTYEGEKVKEEKRVALSKTRKDVSNFLRTTIQESGLYLSKATQQSKEFSEFFKKV
jgi:LETM1 and EF-hand domain-containing protein 1